MAATPSTMVELGTAAPDFQLPDTVSGRTFTLADLKGTVATVVMFICNHCPYVKHVNAGLVALANEYRDRGIGFVAISSNDVSRYPEDGPANMKKTAEAEGYPFPYLYDESQEVARAYDAACTPDFFVYNESLKLVYRGQLDDARPGNGKPVTGRDLREVLTALLEGRRVPERQVPSIGCGIKWKTAS